MEKIAIIGGGASGLAAAIACGRIRAGFDPLTGDPDPARAHASRQADVVVFEAADRLGKPVLATGNGRCNYSNARIDPSVYRNASFVKEALDVFSSTLDPAPSSWFPDNACADGVYGDLARLFFNSLGMLDREESEGRLYPASNKAATVADVLCAEVRRLDVGITCGTRVERIERAGEGSPFTLVMEDGRREVADTLIIAVGGKGPRALYDSLHIDRLPAKPVLGPLKADGLRFKKLHNTRAKASVTLERTDGAPVVEHGEILFRDYGLSGICIFNLSRFAQAGDRLSIDVVPGYDVRVLEDFLNRQRRRLDARIDGLSEPAQITWEDVLRGIIASPLAREIVHQAGKRRGSLSARDAHAIALTAKGLEAVVAGPGDERQCQVNRGGVRVDAVDAATFEVDGHPRVHVIGEALDVDGPCGGFNLYWAWMSGLAAGTAAVRGALS